MQCTFNVTSRRVRVPIVVVEKQRVLHNLSVCICSLRYPACNARAPYCPSVAYLAVPRFSTFSHKCHDFRGEKLLKIKRVFRFALQLLSEMYLVVRRIQVVMIKSVYSC
jgi:hypothetical protein